MSHLQPQPDDDNAELDPEAAMREMMGFSAFESFTTRPKKRPEASNATSSSNNIASSATGANSHPLPDRPNFSLSRLSAARPPGVQQKQQPAADSGPVTEPPFPTEQHSVYVFASPQTGIPYTKQDLEELARGRIDERGDRVYFKPGFVDDDPWSRLHNGVQSRTKGGGGRGKRSRENGESAEHEHWATAKVEALTI